MSNVTSLFKKTGVQEAICEAADVGLTELVVIGKKADGTLWLRYSPCKNVFTYIGMLDALKHDLLHESDN